tara:strand:- start:1837 stop:2058 length:222 start_codon:yes stop_codon:yes gene_type:complete
MNNIELAKEIIEQVNSGASGSDIIQLLDDNTRDKQALTIHVVSKCDCDNHIACIVCGEEKGLDGDFWKRMKEQ